MQVANDPKFIHHQQIFLESETDSEKRVQKLELKKVLRSNCHLNVENIKIDDLNEFRFFLTEKWLSIKSANAYMISFRSFFKFLKKQWVTDVVDPTTIDLIKTKDRQVTFLEIDEITKLFSSIDRESIQWKRDYAILECIYSTGLRISELTNLNKNLFVRDIEEFTIRGKWGKLRIVYLTNEAKTAIQDYLDARGNDHFSPLFIRHNFDATSINNANLTDENVRLSRFFITNMIKERAIKAGIMKDISAHTIRHSFATTLLSNGADIRSIQELLGHSSITTTQVYTHVTNPRLKEIHKKFHW